jgi:type IV secretion system protein TrbL
MSIPSSDILTTITQQYSNATVGWYSYLFPIASHLFAMLAIIELAWSGLWWMVEKSEMTSLWAELLKKIVVIGFFYFIMLNAQTWLPAIIRSFMMIGAGASHLSALDPSSLLSQGISIASTVFIPLEKAGLLNTNLGEWIVAGISSLIILISFAVIAGLLVVTLVESYMVVGAGVLMLGFSSSRWTMQYSINYLTYAISVGVKLFVLYLVVGVGSTIAATWGDLILTEGFKNLSPYFEVLGSSIVFAFIAFSIPAKASSLVSGSSHSSVGALVGAAATAGAATTLPIKAAFGATDAIKETIKQGATIGKAHREGGGSSLGAAIKGAAGASLNLGASALGSAVGYYPSASKAMAEKTDNLQQKYAAQAETRASQGNATSSTNTSRPTNPPPPPSASSGGGSTFNSALKTVQQADTNSHKTVQAPPPSSSKS